MGTGFGPLVCSEAALGMRPFISSNKTIHHGALEPTYDPRIFLDTQHVRKRLAAPHDANIWTTERFLASNTNDCHGQPVNSEMSCTGDLTMHELCPCTRRENIPDHIAGLRCRLETDNPHLKVPKKASREAWRDRAQTSTACAITGEILG
ncbi:uncharacterized protein LOC129212464 isoform X2 [Grus americana]|uniref:uncharacterized protein LOC129212464 isoform X2 n=1 Tax=Grus americana TaxID=9117 RepID=UPI0024082E67|nr:uncharacterized protein LOC129212464 isoform X2 [Grus americana]